MSSASSLRRLSLSNSFLSLSQSTFFVSSLFFFFTPYEFQIEYISSARPRVDVVVHGRALVSFPNLVRVSILLRWRVLSWQRDSILRPSEKMTCILPQDHGVLAINKASLSILFYQGYTIFYIFYYFRAFLNIFLKIFMPICYVYFGRPRYVGPKK